jgi:putative component of membrane protein insertase Oxa1/YidC/SpoIIIJ protein YidD
MRRSTISLLAVVLLLFSGIEGFAGEDSMKGPWGHSFSKAVGEGGTAALRREKESSLPSAALLQGILFFKDTLSKVDGDRCPSYPTCSAYGEMTIRKHGFVIGLLMTVDRLIHEASESKTSPVIKKYGVQRIYDPPENNDFWFTK